MNNGKVTSEILDRLPPHDREAEMGVLGSLLLVPELCDEVAILLRVDDFYADANQTIYRHMLALHEQGKRIDAVLLRSRLKQSADFDNVGGDAYLVDLARAVPTAGNAEHYARIVREKAALRNLIFVSTQLLKEAYDHGAQPLEVAAKGERAFGQIAIDGHQTTTTDAATAVDDVLARARELRQRGRSLGLPVGIPDFDVDLGGLFPGELILLAARPRVGKTALATQIAVSNAERKRDVLFVSLEMAARELMGRALCARAGVDANRIRKGSLTERDLTDLEGAGEWLRTAALHTADPPAATTADIRAMAKALHRRKPLSLIVVDYIQRIQASDLRAPRYQQLGQISGDLKKLARELGVPVLALAQLGRQAESEKDHRPRLSHLRESGDLEADADQVLLLHREELYRPNDPDLRGKAVLIVGKNRNGPSDMDFKLRWDGKTTQFSGQDELGDMSWEEATEPLPLDETEAARCWTGNWEP